ncbi:cytochrome p460, putative [Acidisarcina polymorpha]|uniref:Cytochrome p460, putative n=1 Tax=Acidisarcina polymorpha TaxID=2211140 RepID=A0A2Z5FX62_9BACT|nr:cytochrome P460 family protein [Acidisarcina polymorpha]AXC11362.1 cytochrome p460, putative [Acidisarcina polymorpha]
MKTLSRLIVAAVLIFGLLQLVRPGIPSMPASAELQAPPEIKHILEKDCYSCHSNQRRLSWFDQIVPGYWLVRHDILTAREHVNFSTIGSKPIAMQKATLFEAVNMIQLGAMPLPMFLKLHPEAKVTPDELAMIKAYLAPWSSKPNPPGSAPKSTTGGETNESQATGGKTDASPAAIPAETPALVSLAAVPPELNGFRFDPTFESWKPISFSDRGDNYTFRYILGNDVAVKAAAAGNISPWPDDARFAKIAWQQESGADGLIHPGKFVQVELMQKDAKAYRKTEGWGWGRWRGLDLKPYGNDAHFVNECTSCHLPVRGDDYVYTLPMSAARVGREEAVNSRAADLPPSLPYQPLGWNAITMYVDPKNHTMATLYGNDSAVQAVRPRGYVAATVSKGQAYPANSVLALVTSAQREDPHWFGARIPDAPEAVEFVEVAAAGSEKYRRFSGTGLTEEHGAPADASQRAQFIMGLAPAQLP